MDPSRSDDHLSVGEGGEWGEGLREDEGRAESSIYFIFQTSELLTNNLKVANILLINMLIAIFKSPLLPPLPSHSLLPIQQYFQRYQCHVPASVDVPAIRTSVGVQIHPHPSSPAHPSRPPSDAASTPFPGQSFTHNLSLPTPCKSKKSPPCPLHPPNDRKRMTSGETAFALSKEGRGNG